MRAYYIVFECPHVWASSVGGRVCVMLGVIYAIYVSMTAVALPDLSFHAYITRHFTRHRLMIACIFIFIYLPDKMYACRRLLYFGF